MFKKLFGKSNPEPIREPWLRAPGFEILKEQVSRDKAWARWNECRNEFANTGLWPTLVPLGDVETVEETFELNAGAEMEDVDVEAFFAGKREELAEMAEEFEDDEFEPMDFDFDPFALVPPRHPSVEKQVYALTKAEGDLLIALHPCKQPWEVPFLFGFGDWNACPKPFEHAALLRKWNAEYGAVPIVIGHDTIELLVTPIRDPEVAKKVAIEQYLYAPDIVDQGTETVEALATTLIGASSWFFWWD